MMLILLVLMLVGAATQLESAEAPSFSRDYQTVMNAAHTFNLSPNLAPLLLKELAQRNKDVAAELAQFFLFSNPMQLLEEYVDLIDADNKRLPQLGALPPLNPHCEYEIAVLLLALVKKAKWTIPFIDAIFKPPAGILDGNINWFGAFDECVGINVNNEMITTVGTYCLIPILEIAKFGVCVPSSCGPHDMYLIVGALNSFVQKNFTLGFNITTNEAKIQCNNPNLPVTSYFIIAWSIVGVIVLFNAIGTIYDIVKRVKAEYSSAIVPTGSVLDISASSSLFFGNNATSTAVLPSSQGITDDEAPLVSDINKPPTSVLYATESNTVQPSIHSRHESSKLSQYLLAFSFIRNASKIITVETPTSRGQHTLQALHGIRLLTMFWVILCHSVLLTFNTGVDNLLPLLNMTQQVEFQVILHGFYAVDTFFVLGGFLLGYLTLRQLDKLESAPGSPVGKIFKFFGKFYLHRYLRLTPCYGLLILVYMGISPYFMYGPVWQQFTDPMCVNNWWKNLLYVQNIVDRDQECMGWAWYLAVDFQLFLISPIPLLAFWWRPLAGWLVTIAILVGTSLASGLVASQYNLPGAPLSTLLNNHTMVIGVDDFKNHFFGDYYIVPWCRAAPWIIGLALGCAIHRLPPSFANSRLQSPKLRIALNVIGWTVATALGLVLVYGMWPVYMGYYTLPAWASQLYWAASRIGWGLAISWVIYACISGAFPGNFVRRFLSWSPFVALSRLTYNAYLFHPIVMCTYFWTIRIPVHLYDMQMAYDFLASVVLVFASVFIVAAGVEVPLANLERIILTKNEHRD